MNKTMKIQIITDSKVEGGDELILPTGVMETSELERFSEPINHLQIDHGLGWLKDRRGRTSLNNSVSAYRLQTAVGAGRANKPF